MIYLLHGCSVQKDAGVLTQSEDQACGSYGEFYLIYLVDTRQRKELQILSKTRGGVTLSKLVLVPLHLEYVNTTA